MNQCMTLMDMGKARGARLGVCADVIMRDMIAIIRERRKLL